MYILRLVKGRSYTGAVKVKAEKPLVGAETKEIADYLLSTGRFELVSTPAKPEPSTDSGEKPLDKMTEKELDAYAAAKGIDLTGLTKKAEKLAKLQAVAVANEDGADSENNEVTFVEDE